MAANDKGSRRWKMDCRKGEKREPSYYKKGRNMSLDKALPLIVEAMKKGVGAHSTEGWLSELFYAEPIGIYLDIKTHIVKQAFHKLNLKGIVSQREIWTTKNISGFMHTRLDYCDDVIQWEAKRYYVDLDKLRDFKC